MLVLIWRFLEACIVIRVDPDWSVRKCNLIMDIPFLTPAEKHLPSHHSIIISFTLASMLSNDIPSWPCCSLTALPFGVM